ncbi:insulinase family protein [Candidatus Berkelbacteria bacterium]|nr:insulinase family protein [Candidatus Berkelbacteria bacterium]
MQLSFTRQVLPNQLRLLVTPMHETKAVTILILIGAGSRYEEARTNGVAHFLEHMFFKGTTNRPSTADIARELDALGADYNAFTGEEYTGFYVRVAGDDFAQAFDIITDMLLNPLFVPEEIEREKGVIVEEINMYEDNPMRSIHDHAKRLFYGDTPLGRNIAGTKETVTAFDRADFLHFRETFYQPDNLVIAIAGAGESATWQTTVTKRLGDLAGTATTRFVAADHGAKTPQLKLVTKQTDQAHLILGFPGFARNDDRRPTLRVMQNILGGTMSSRLFMEVRERRGLAYYVKSDIWDFRDTGAFVARAGVQVDKIDDAIQVILDQFRSLARSPVTEEELDRAQKNLRGGLYLNLEDSMAIADFLADQELLLGNIKQPETLVKEIEGVKREAIQTLGADLIDFTKTHLTVIGPYDDPSRFEKLLKS